MSSVSSANSKTGNMLKCWCAFYLEIQAHRTRTTRIRLSRINGTHTYAHSLALTLPYSQHVDAISFASTCSITVHRTLSNAYTTCVHIHTGQKAQKICKCTYAWRFLSTTQFITSRYTLTQTPPDTPYLIFTSSNAIYDICSYMTTMLPSNSKRKYTNSNTLHTRLLSMSGDGSSRSATRSSTNLTTL
jgi:hypothetical protein